MNFDNPKHTRSLAFCGVFLFLLFTLQYSGHLPRLHGAAPFNLMLPAVVFAGMFFGPWEGALIGLAAGIFSDAISAGATGFNTIAFFLIGCAAGLFIQHLFNNTAVAAVLLSAGASLLFETARYLFTYIVIGYANTGFYYTRYSLASAFLTTLLAIPIYFLFKKLMKIAGR
ncbi:MAG: rod shape-determining protein MreD [Candidatus Howiella sp.]|jgi:rod shape-determining protein MreD